MNSIDEDAKLIGIDEKIWREFRNMTKKTEQPYLDGFLEAEAEARESDISYDAWFEHKKRLAMRWFGYYRKTKTVQEAQKIGTQYNKIGLMIERGKQR